MCSNGQIILSLLLTMQFYHLRFLLLFKRNWLLMFISYLKQDKLVEKDFRRKVQFFVKYISF
jgi:hypothetical protein